MVFIDFHIRSIRRAVSMSLLLAGAAWCQQPAPDSPRAAQNDPTVVTPQPQQETQDKRIFGVLPNYRTADGTKEFRPLTWKQKFTIGAKDSFDYPFYFLSGAFASLSQLEDQNPSFGQGLKGFAKRYGTSYGDQLIGNMMTESLWPSLL